MKKITKEHFNQSLIYEGYLWLSNAAHPLVFHGRIVPEEHLKQMFPTTAQIPFIVEGHLYAKGDNEKSIKVITIDGITTVYQVDLQEIPEEQFTTEEFFVDSSRFLGISGIRAVQFWEKRSDLLQPDYQSEVPAWVAFRGFVH